MAVTSRVGSMDSITIEIPLMYAKQVRSVDACRIIGEAIELLNSALGAEGVNNEAIWANLNDLELIQAAMGQCTSAIRSAMIAEEQNHA